MPMCCWHRGNSSSSSSSSSRVGQSMTASVQTASAASPYTYELRLHSSSNCAAAQHPPLPALPRGTI
jgi:hypothetical protein